MTTQYTITEGWTEPLRFYANANGSKVALPVSTTTLIIKGSDDVAIDTAGVKTEVPTQTGDDTGAVDFLPAAGDFVARLSPYTIHVKAIDTDGKIVFFPSGERDQIVVKKQ